MLIGNTVYVLSLVVGCLPGNYEKTNNKNKDKKNKQQPQTE